MKIFKKCIDKLEKLLCLPWFNFIKTIYINFRSLPLKHAVKLPIYVYGNCEIYSLQGDFVIEGPVRRGMIRLGMPNYGPAIDCANTYIYNLGKVVFKGSATFCNGVSLYVMGGTLVLNKAAYLGEKVRVVCSNFIEIGEGTRIAHESQIMDTNFHYIIDENKRTISSPQGKVIIGKWCWIGNRTTIQRGSYVPDNTIVGSNSLLNKKYVDEHKSRLIVGSPAKIVRTGLCRIFNIESERMLNTFFEENGINATYDFLDSDIESFCKPQNI